MKKQGWLVVNGFLHSQKFSELYQFLLNNAPQCDLQLSIVPTDMLMPQAGCNLNRQVQFAIFWDKDIVLAKHLEREMPLFNSAHTIEVCDSKSITALALCGEVPMPTTLLAPKTFEGVGYTDFNFVERAADTLGLPMVIKQAQGSFGQQVYLAQTVEQAKQIAQQLAGKDFVFQRFVAESSGRDVRVNVVGGKVVNAILRTSTNGDFRSNITLGGSMRPYQLSEEQQKVALRACQLVGAHFAGVDLLLSNDGPLVCEVNSNLHFKTTYQCTGVDISKHILQHVRQCLQ